MKIIYTALFLLGFSALAQAQNALDFDGSNDYVQTTFSGVTGTTNRTFEAWVYVGTGLSGNQCIMDYGANLVGSRNTFYINANYQLGYISGGTNANISSSTNAVPTNQWVHVAFVLNSGTGYLYVNGAQVGTGSLTTVNTPTGVNSLRIGQRVPGGSIPFDGVIDEVRVWNVARTASELTANKDAEFCTLPAALVAYYKLNSGVAGGNNAGITTAIDDASTNNGTLTNFSLSGNTSNWVGGKALATGSEDSTTVTACGSYTSPSGSNTWTTSGNYIDTVMASGGCDSIVYIDLTINPNSAGSLTTAGCNSYTSPSGNYTWTNSGNYTDTLPSASGCDSIISINLTINTVDTNVLQNGITLTSWATGVNYQWLDCNNAYAPVAGATSQTFIPTADGSYAVELDDNGCIDTSACYTVTGVGISEERLQQVRVFPNPSKANGSIQFSLPPNLNDVSFSIHSLSGAVLHNGIINTTHKLSLRLAAGTYILRISKDSSVINKKIVVL